MSLLVSSSAAIAETKFSGGATRYPREVFALCALLLTAAVAWQVVTWAVTGGVGYWTSAPAPAAHATICVFCLGLAVQHALRLRGQLDFKVAGALSGVAMIFGVYALLILGGRFFFSRPLLVSTAAEAALLALAVVCLKHKLAPARVAIVGPLAHGATLPTPAVLVSEPEADLRQFDVLLVSLTGPVSSDWSRALARAMLCGSRIRHVGEYLEEQRGAVSLEHFEHDHVTLQSVASYRPIKRLVDVLLVLAALPVAVPALLVSMIAIAACTGFPVFFVQERIGLGCHKFRMRNNPPPRARRTRAGGRC